MTSAALTRREAFAVAATAAAASAAGLSSASAAAPLQGAMRPGVRRFRLGAFEVTTLHDGYVVADDPHAIFGMDQPREAVAALAAENLLPFDRLVNNFTVTLVNTGAELVLFDTGNPASRGPTAGNTLARLADAGVTPDQIDVVVITHMHGDHVGGLMRDGAPTFPNARYVTGAVEHNFWTGGSAPEQGAANAKAQFGPVAEKATFIDPGAAVVSGVDAVDGFGHSPGHMAYHVESEGQRLLITADAGNHYVLSLQRPDWHVRFDMDKAAAAATRKRLFGMVAADRIPFIGYHMPAPAVGFLTAEGQGFRWHPETYQLS